jgi:predicted RNase H-like nuclease (RuvC/YqgF family)
METKISKSKIILASVMALLIVIAGIFYSAKISSDKNLNKEKIKNEALLSEKIKLDEMVNSQKKENTLLVGKNAQLDRILFANTKEIEKKEQEIKRLYAANSSISSLKQKIAELEALKNKLNTDIDQLNAANNVLTSENTLLSEQLKSSQTENNALAINNSILRALVADNYRVEATKGRNNKLTLNAKRTNQLTVSFDLPADATENLHFKVIAPDGKEYASINDASAFIKVSDSNNLLASTDNIISDISTRHTEMVYKPTMKLQKGVYKFNIYNKNDYLGSTQLRLK